MVQYPNKEALGKMAATPEYQAIHHHRTPRTLRSPPSIPSPVFEKTVGTTASGIPEMPFR